METVKLQIDNYGVLTGLSDGTVNQFKNVPYGKLNKRFTEAVLAKDVGELDCTKQGPLCPQIKPYDDDWNGIEEGKTKPIELRYDEFNCLHSIITMPASLPEDGSLLPIVIWLHGGGNNAGTIYRGSNDPTDWVRTGCEINRPFIAITPQFRLNAFGFLPFKGKGNWGLLDQKLCIKWVHENAKALGGDVNKLTVCGQSAGAACALCQSQVEAPLFTQSGYFSGSLRSLPARSLQEYADLSKRICRYLNCSEDELSETPAARLVEAVTALKIDIYSPVDDGYFMKKGGYNLPPTAMSRVIVSDCNEDAFYYLDDPNIVQSIKDNIPSDLYPDPLTPTEACKLTTDIFFAQSTHWIDVDLKDTKTKVFRILFDAINPVTPSCGNNHMVELHYVNNYYDARPEFKQAIRQVQELWTRLICFENPWNPDAEFMRITEKLASHPYEELVKYRNVDRIQLLKGQWLKSFWKFVTGW